VGLPAGGEVTLTGGATGVGGRLRTHQRAQLLLRRGQLGLQGRLLRGQLGGLLPGGHLRGLGDLQGRRRLLLQHRHLHQGGAGDLVGLRSLCLQDGDLAEDVGPVGTRGLEQRGALDQLAEVGGGDEGGGTGVGAALHVAAASERHDVAPGDAEVGGRLRGGGLRRGGLLLRGLDGGLRGLVLVEGDRRGGVGGVDGLLCGGQLRREVADPGRDGVGRGLRGGDLGVTGPAGGRLCDGGGQPDDDGDGERRPGDPGRRAQEPASRTAVHASKIDRMRPRVDRVSPHGDRRHGRVTAEAAGGDAQLIFRSESAQKASRSLNFWILPVAVRASSSRNSTRLGAL